MTSPRQLVLTSTPILIWSGVPQWLAPLSAVRVLDDGGAIVFQLNLGVPKILPARSTSEEAKGPRHRKKKAEAAQVPSTEPSPKEEN